MMKPIFLQSIGSEYRKDAIFAWKNFYLIKEVWSFANRKFTRYSIKSKEKLYA